MSDSKSTQGPPDAVPKAKARPPRRWSIIWLIPLVTVGVAGWIAYKTISEEGPKIAITFETADGLEAGKTKIMYKGVQAGTVNSILVSEDLSNVVVNAEMVKEAEGHLTEGTQFWVVRPHVSLTRISGLGTLVSGAFIAMKPGAGGLTLKFKGLEEPPISDQQGQIFTLHAEQLGSISVSAPVYHRGIAVGEVLKYDFAEDDAGVAIEIVVDTPHQDLVRKSSLFWNASGLDVSLGNIFDASLRVGSLESLVAGGIAFGTPPGQSEAAVPKADFKLHDERPPVLESAAVDEGLKLVLTAEALGGVKLGDEITFRQIAVGEVVETRLAKDTAGVEIEVSIKKEHAALVRENSQFWNVSGIKVNLGNILDPSVQVSSLESLVAGGIAFLTPAQAGPPAKPGHRFALLDEQPKDVGESAAEAAKELTVLLTAEDLRGIGEGDPVLYREIEIGQVRDTRLNAAASGVEIELGIAKAHAALIRSNSVFWNASGITLNLGDLVDASVEIEFLKSLLVGGIALANPPDPGPPAQDGASYRLHAERPNALFRQKKEADALHIVLKSETQGSVKADDPILFREVQVGKVSEVALSEDASFVELHVAIEPRYAPLVRVKSVFWNASGIHASFGLFSGADIDIESLSALLRGGIAFATPPDGGAAATDGAAYVLHNEPKKDWQSWAPHIRLPKEAPKPVPVVSGGQPPAEPGAPKPTHGIVGEQEAPAQAQDKPAVEQEATATSTSETEPLPDAVSLSGAHVSTSALTEALTKLGFTNVGEIHKTGSIVRAEADWQGETVKLHIDTRRGRIERID